jgi:hypothetical protein
VIFVLLPIILAFGFVGCFIKPERPPDLPPEFTETFNITLTDQRQRSNRCIVIRIEPGRLSRSGTLVKLFIQRPANNDLNIRDLYISEAADVGNPYDAPTAPTLVLSNQLVPQDQNLGIIELEPVEFTLDETKPLLIAVNVGTSGAIREVSNVLPLDGRSFVGPPDLFEAGQAIRSPNYQSEDRLYLITRIEVA